MTPWRKRRRRDGSTTVLKTLTHPALLVVDEIGYLPVSQSGAVLFFQLVNRRYERASTVLTSNKGFEEWGPDPGGRGDGGGAAGPGPAPVLHRQHPGQQLSDAPPQKALEGDIFGLVRNSGDG